MDTYNNQLKGQINRLTPAKVPEKYQRWLQQAFNKWQKHIPVYKGFNVVCYSGNSKFLGHYMCGSYKHPLILLYLDIIEDDAYLDGLEATFKITVYHELGHALCQYQRKLGHKIISSSNEEKFVEMFSRRMHYNHPLQQEIYQMIDVILSQR